jgi:hypothetical protein
MLNDDIEQLSQAISRQTTSRFDLNPFSSWIQDHIELPNAVDLQARWGSCVKNVFSPLQTMATRKTTL